MRQIQIAAGITKSDGTTALPGTNSFTVWLTNLAANAHLSTNDLGKLFSAPGVVIKGLPQYAMGKTALRVYQVSSNSPDNTVFLSTFNWNAETPNVPLSPNSIPYGDKLFIIFHKGGDGIIFKGSQATNTNLFGTFTNNVRP